ncbi:GNAT family N-acetyltransferase [Arachidicoccus terrestris]|uniref:GNAT family N-acetyltransferase n=1 Tax=Arachidicoccus terrestris TaxID=2875539 RepID=UPI001CC7656E|nr:GNAT family protein [Arachidicoccus terrestris]UAY53766.1 GNAT family N-acetyltransferase [Arachidicoccus terrestris]
MEFQFNKEIILENDRVLLRPITAADTRNLIYFTSQQEDLLQYSPNPVHTEVLLKKYIDKAIGERKLHNRYTFCVFDKIQNRYAGSTSFLNISNVNDRLEIGGTWYSKQFQRTGLNRNCKFLMLEFAFKTLGAVRVEFKTDERNTASRDAIEKIGGQFEGLLRCHTLMYDGFRRNTACYSILKREWALLRKDFLAFKQ